MLPALTMSAAGLGTLVLLCALLLWLVRLPRREVRSTALSLLRCVFPAWRFFEEIADVPLLSHRVIEPGCAPEPWVTTLHQPMRTASMLFLNAPGNLHLAQQALIEHLAAQLEEEPDADPARTASYRLVQALVAQRIRRDRPFGTGHYQFQLCGRASASGGLPTFLSQTHTL